MRKFLSLSKKTAMTIFAIFAFVAVNAVEVTVNFTTSDGTPIEGTDVDFKESGGTWSYLGTTDENGQIIADVGPVSGHGIFKFFYDDVSKQVSQNINLDPIVTLRTVNTTFKILDLEGNELTGTNARYKTAGIWKTFGSGTTTTNHELLPGGYAFRVNYNGVQKDITKAINNANNEVILTINLITVRLLNSEGADIASDDIQYQSNGEWIQFGDGATPESIELLPATTKFRVYYNGAYQQVSQNLAQNPEVIFNTYAVAYHSTGTIQYSFAGGPFLAYNPPMELLGVNYKFRFSNDGYPDRDLTKTISNSETKSLAFVQFLSSAGDPIPGAQVEFNGGLGWFNGFSTDGQGVSFNLLDGELDTLQAKINYLGSSNEVEQDVSMNSYIDFNTVLVKMELLSSTGDQLNSSNAEFRSDMWRTFGSGVTPDSLEMLRDTYQFKVYYAGADDVQAAVTIDSNQTVTFNTVAVTMELLSSQGDEVESDNAIYSAFGSTEWFSFGDGVTTETIELLPENYKFRLTYGGATKQKNQNVGNDPLVSYELTEVTVRLLDEDDNELESNNITYFISGGGWNQFSDGVTTATMDLFEAFYDFRVYYNGDVMQMAQQIGNDPVVTFYYIEEDGMMLTPEQFQNDMIAKEAANADKNAAEKAVANISEKGNYPNPFSGTTFIEIEVEEASDLNLTVFDMQGKVVKVVMSQYLNKGTFRVEFDGTDQNGQILPAGMYLYKLQGESVNEVRRMIIRR